jgi:NADH dehydrogenase FAD-containing subunit
MYIPTFGLTPNSSYIPSQYLNKGGFVVVDEYLRLKGATDVFAIGDVADVETKQYTAARAHAFYVAKSITALLQGKGLVPFKVSTSMYIHFDFSS